MIAMQSVKLYSDPTQRLRKPGDLSGVLFQNIEIAAPSELGAPHILWGAPEAPIIDMTFDNVSIGSKKIISSTMPTSKLPDSNSSSLIWAGYLHL
ncbi:MAG: hypothetical protein ACI8XO_002053 [Verrucomicrobiales bacterium]|jgi:hypothetical protein